MARPCITASLLARGRAGSSGGAPALTPAASHSLLEVLRRLARLNPPPAGRCSLTLSNSR